MVFIALATSCNPEEKYPKDVSFTEYSLSETQCQWANLPYDNKVIIVNSIVDLEKHIDCESYTYPIVDFSKHSLLIVSGLSNSGISEIDINSLRQLSSHKYELNIDMLLDGIKRQTNWVIALVVDRMNNKDCIETLITDTKLPSLLNTKWKLAGIVEEATGLLRVIEPKDCERCYTLRFNTDCRASGMSTSNQIEVELDMERVIYKLTKMGEIGDGYLFGDILLKVTSYLYRENELRFLYKENGEKYYLKYYKIDEL